MKNIEAVIGRMMRYMHEKLQREELAPLHLRLEAVESRPDPGFGDIYIKLNELSDVAERNGNRLRDDVATLRERLAAAESSLKGVDDKIELARVNSELRIEQAHSLIKDARDMHGNADQLIDGLQKELNAAQCENARLMEEIEKAAAERLEHLGPYTAGKTYRRNNIVMRDRSSYICVADETTSDPREKLDTPSWRLFAKSGDRGPQGPQGQKGERGLKGLKGEPGQAGTDGAGLRSISTSGMAAVLVSSDGQAHRIDLTKAIESLVEQKIKELPK